MRLARLMPWQNLATKDDLRGLEEKMAFCSYIDYRYALADESCNLVECGNHAYLFNKVFKVALDVDLTKRIKDGAELYSLLTGMPPRVHYGNVNPSSLLAGLREWR
jgi:hypothetical protein